MEKLGTIKAKGQDLIVKAVAVTEHFGSYFKFTNNCQNYCNKYLEAIGLGYAKTPTDMEKLVLVITAILFEYAQ